MVADERAEDHGLTHVALPVADMERSVAFYQRYAAMQVVHDRVDEHGGDRVVWLSDLTRPFVVVLIESKVSHTLGGWSHLGVGCESRTVVDELSTQARAEGINVGGPYDTGPPVGYWAIIPDPDGHNLEVSFGQAIGFTIDPST